MKTPLPLLLPLASVLPAETPRQPSFASRPDSHVDKHIGDDGLANHDYNRDHEMCGSGNLLGGSTNVCSSNTQQCACGAVPIC